MRCKHCNCEIYGKADFCPLCKRPLEPEQNVEEQNKEYIYPIKKKRPKAYKVLSFTPMYWMVAGFVFLISTVINLVLAPTEPWYMLLGIILIYGYMLVQNTIMSRNSIAHKVLWQAILIFAFIWVLAFLLHSYYLIDDVWGFLLKYSLPVVVGISNIVMCILTGCFLHYDKSLIIDVIWVNMLGFIPLILYGSIFREISYAAVATAVISAIIIVVYSIIGRKIMTRQGKYKFHA